MENMDTTNILELQEDLNDPKLKQSLDPYILHNPRKPRSKDQAREIAKRLLASVDISANPVDAYIKLLEKAIHDTAEAEIALKKMEEEMLRLRQVSITDELTGILNRRGFRQELERALERAKRNNQAGLLIMIDLNDFKEINDTHGHKAGDLVLSSAANLLKQNIRRVDSAARLGGDEFAVILAATDPILGREKALLIDHELNTLVVSWNGKKIPVSASVGIEVYDRDSTLDDVLHQADMKMYELKKNNKPAYLERIDPILCQPEGYPYLGK
ncbi:MAG: GGDEF domain-containing protein [Alphaproteobacteria bacterium]|nr:GGDEF domain-containing protein [Alphaproteobacteria bacterium]